MALSQTRTRLPTRLGSEDLLCDLYVVLPTNLISVMRANAERQTDRVRCDAGRHKKRGIDLKTIRRVSIQLVPGPESSPITLVDVVTPRQDTPSLHAL